MTSCIKLHVCIVHIAGNDVSLAFPSPRQYLSVLLSDCVPRSPRSAPPPHHTHTTYTHTPFPPSCVPQVSTETDELRFNTAIASMMEFINGVNKNWGDSRWGGAGKYAL